MKKFLVLTIAIMAVLCIFAGCFNNDSDKDGVSDMSEAQAGDIDDAQEGMGEMQNNEVVSDDSINDVVSVDFMTVTGKASEVKADENETRLIVKDDSTDAMYSEVSAKITKDTIIINTLTEQKSINDINKNADVRVVLNTSEGVMTPEMSDAVMVIIKEEENTAFPNYIHVADTEYKDGKLSALNANGDVVVHIDEKMEIGTLDPAVTASIKDIKEGSKLLCWYDSLTLSDPAGAVPTRIVLINK